MRRSHTHTQYVESDTETDDDDSQQHPTFHLLQHTQSKFSHLSINNKNKSTSPTELDEDAHCIQPPAPPTLDANEEKSFQILQNIIQGGQVEKLKVEQCKLYLRRHGLRLTGKKDILINRIKEHLSIVNGEGEHKYPASSFVMNCKGDACTGDVVMFEQNVYEMFSIASRSATGPPCGQRTVAGRIVKESYGAAKQQHTFTIEVLWSKGTKPLPPLHPLLIKGRNLYRLKTMRQRWEDESERQKILSEKHARGNVARTNRETRLHEKEIKKTLRASKGNIKNEKQEVKRPTIPIVSSRTSIQHANASFMERMDHGASHKENMMPNTSRGLDGPLGKNFQVEQSIKNGKQEYKGKASLTRHPDIPSIQHSGATFMGMDYGAPYRENMNPNTLRGVSFKRQVEQNMGLYPSRLFQRHDYDRRSLPKSYSFQQVGNNGYLPRDHYYQGKRQQLCRLYAQGRCHYGTNCKYLH